MTDGRKRGYILCTLELYLSGLNGTANHSDMQKIRVIGFLFEKKATLAV
jgi:hypothetical protein